MLKRTTKEVAEYFRQQGCELMDEYLGAQEPMDYKCKCGKYGTTTWNNFTHGKRCGNCTKWGQHKKLNIDAVRKLFSDRGCEFLDIEYRGIHHKHHYRCKCGREAEISIAGFRNQNQYCKECGLQKLRKENHPQWNPDRQALREKRLFRKKIYKALSSTLEATGKDKIGHTSDMLGYGPKELHEHVTKHPNWNNVKDCSWHLDHIFPIQAFLDYGIKDIKLINRLDNLQPITSEENNKKKDRYDKDAFNAWLRSKGAI